MANGWQGMPGISGTELERLARQAWDAWAEALRQTAPGAAAGGFAAPGAMPGFGAPAGNPWRDAIEWWTRQAAAPAQPAIGDVLARFNAQGQQWFAEMQRLAMQFAEHGGSPQDIAAAWRQALGGTDANPFAQMFGGLPEPGLGGAEAWMAQLRPLLDALTREPRAWLQQPAFGPAREHQERWQALAQAQMDYQRSQQAYYALLAQASQAAFGIFERKLAEHAAPGRQIESPRALFDLWIDAAEEAYAPVALSLEFRHAYADMVNGQMRLRLAMQQEVEQACRLLDLPTRSELDGAHRKIAELERVVRRLGARVDGIAPRAARPQGVGAQAGAASQAGPARGPALGPAEPVAAKPMRAKAGRTAATDGAQNSRAAKASSGKTATATASAAKTAVPTASTSAPAAGKGVRAAVAKTAAKTIRKPAKQAAAGKTGGNPGRKSGKTPNATSARKAVSEATSKPVTKAATRAATPQRDGANGQGRSRTAAAGGRGPRRAAGAKATRTAARRAPRVAAPAQAVAREATARKSVRRASRVAPLPNYGFISPIPLAPEPLNDAPAKRARKKKR